MIAEIVRQCPPPPFNQGRYQYRRKNSGRGVQHRLEEEQNGGVPEDEAPTENASYISNAYDGFPGDVFGSGSDQHSPEYPLNGAHIGVDDIEP